MSGKLTKINKILSLGLLLFCFQNVSANTLPTDIQWLTNDTDPIYASPKATKGGTFREFILSFPLTLRRVGPDSNSAFRGHIGANQLSLTSVHPNTMNVIPSLATHWAYDADEKTVYYKLDTAARWSDGKAITADDYLFTLEFMRSKHITAPWYNNHYQEQIKQVIKYDDYTIAIEGATQKPTEDLHYFYGLSPTPKHFHKLNKDWVKNYNWKIEPNSGPYQISKIKKGKTVTFVRKKDWWAKDKRFFKNRFNVDKVIYKVIKDHNIAYKHFLKGNLDSFGLVLPNFWHEKAKGELYDRGYLHKTTFFNDLPQPSYGLFLNQDDPLLNDKNIRYGLAHALNFDKVINKVLRGDYTRLNSFHSGYGEYSNNDIKARAFDLKKADKYFNDAGWNVRDGKGIRTKNNQRLSFTLTYGKKYHTDRIVVLKEEAKKAGIELNLLLMDPAAAYKNVMEKKHQIAWMGWSAGYRPAFWQHFHSANAHKSQTNNITNMDNPELDKKIMAYRDEIKKANRIVMAKEIAQLIHDSGAFIPRTKVPYTRGAHWRWIQFPETPATRTSGSIYAPFGSDGGLFWINKEEKIASLKAKKQDKAFTASTQMYEQFRSQL
jgi:microcin C transport system substrate-binding protein